MKLRNGKTTGNDFKGIIGYKVCRCAYSDDVKIVTLLIPETAKHNVNREMIIDKQYAKHRCSEALVAKIEPPGLARSLMDDLFFYKVGSTVRVDNYNVMENKICGFGIHFYLDKEVARMYALELSGEDGDVIEWYSSGALKTTYSKLDGIIHGLMKSYDEFGNLKSEGYVQKGERHGIWKFYCDPPRNHTLEETYDHGKLCAWREWDNDGGLVAEGMLSEETPGKIMKTFRSYHKNGKIKSQRSYCNDMKEGETKFWYEDGQLEAVLNFKNDKGNGPLRYWHKNGVLRTEFLLEDGLHEGEVTAWHENGILAMQGYYIKGKMNGTRKEWDEQGKLVLDCVFVDGNMI